MADVVPCWDLLYFEHTSLEKIRLPMVDVVLGLDSLFSSTQASVDSGPGGGCSSWFGVVVLWVDKL